jgi:hypothetical protein
VRQPVKLGERASERARAARKAAIALLGVSVCLLASTSPALAAKAKPKKATPAAVLATLTIRTPNVAVKAKGKTSYTAGKNGQTLRQGDALRTDTAGLAEISYTDGSYTRLGPGTEYKITTLTNKKGARQTKGTLTIGSTFSRAAKVSETGAFEIKAGGATAAVEGTVFVVIGTKQGNVVSWQFIPFHSLIYQGAVRQIPESMYEAAQIDGAGRVRQFFSITLPQLKFTIITSSTLMVVGSVTFFDIIFVLTQGGPADATTNLAMAMYKRGFQANLMGEASAIAVIIVLLGLALALLLRRLGGRDTTASQLEGA